MPGAGRESGGRDSSVLGGDTSGRGFGRGAGLVSALVFLLVATGSCGDFEFSYHYRGARRLSDKPLQVRTVFWPRQGAMAFAVEPVEEGPPIMHLIPVSGEGACRAGPVNRFAAIADEDGLYLALLDRDGGRVRFYDERCQEWAPDVDRVEELDLRSGRDGHRFLLTTEAGSVYITEPLAKRVSLFAENVSRVGSGILRPRGHDAIWVLAGGKVAMIDGFGRVLPPVVEGVRQFDNYQGPGADWDGHAYVAVQQGRSICLVDMTAPAFDDDPDAWRMVWTTVHDEAAWDTAGEDASADAAPDEGQADDDAGEAGSTDEAGAVIDCRRPPADLAADARVGDEAEVLPEGPKKEGACGPRIDRVAGSCMGKACEAAIEGEPVARSSVPWISYLWPCDQQALVLRTDDPESAPIPVVDDVDRYRVLESAIDGLPVVLYRRKGDDVDHLQVLGQEPYSLGAHVVFGTLRILSDAMLTTFITDESSPRLVVWHPEEGSEVLLSGVQTYSPSGLVLHDFDADTGLGRLSFCNGRRCRAIADGVPENSYSTYDSLERVGDPIPLLAFLHEADPKTRAGRLSVRDRTTGAVVDVAEGVTKFAPVELGGARGLVYTVPDGERRGLWYVPR